VFEGNSFSIPRMRLDMDEATRAAERRFRATRSYRDEVDWVLAIERSGALGRLAMEDPRGRDEPTWLAVVGHLVRRFEAAFNTSVELGSYWFESPADYASGGFSCRVRGIGRFPGLPCDEWEASLSLSGNAGELAHASVDLFPFKDGRRETPEAQYWLCTYDLDRDTWRAHGFTHVEGPGEWEWIQRTGDLFHEHDLACSTESRAGPPALAIELDDEVVGTLAVSLESVVRDALRLTVPSRDGPLFPRSSIERRPFQSHERRVHVDLEQFTSLPGDWARGTYRLVLRCTGPWATGARSSLVDPVEFVVDRDS
jgi:hypothetical protein